jgi:hypothetical protein
VRPRVPVRGLVALATVLGSAAVPAAGLSQEKRAPNWVCPAQVSKCATLIVHVYVDFGGGPEEPVEPQTPVPPPKPAETAPLLIEKLRGPGAERGEVLGTWLTKEHKLRVAPGRYQVAVAGSQPTTIQTSWKRVTASAPRTLEVTLRIRYR